MEMTMMVLLKQSSARGHRAMKFVQKDGNALKYEYIMQLQGKNDHPGTDAHYL